MSRSYYRVRLGEKGIYADECYAGGFIGVHWNFKEDLSGQFGGDWRAFNARFRPVYLERHFGGTMVAAGLACGMLWTVGQGMKVGDLVVCPDSNGDFMFGEISGPYFWRPGGYLPQCRSVSWYPGRTRRAEIGDDLWRSMRVPGTVIMLNEYADELERLARTKPFSTDAKIDDNIESLSAFALEKHLEDFLVANWSSTELGNEFDIYEEDGQVIGQQYLSDTGPMDILAISRDRKTLLVVELKRGRASDVVVGQIQRYMGYVKSELAKPNQIVRGIIIAYEDDIRLRRALSVATGIDFFRYEVNFRLKQG